MKAKETYVIFTDQHGTYPCDVTRGAIVAEDLVFVAEEMPGVYKFQPTVSENYVLVDLEKEPKDYLEKNDGLLVDLVLGKGLQINDGI